MAKTLIIAGVILILLGLLAFWKNPFAWMGHLPGDIAIEKEGFKFYFPIVTCVVVSVALTLIFSVFRSKI